MILFQTYFDYRAHLKPPRFLMLTARCCLIALNFLAILRQYVFKALAAYHRQCFQFPHFCRLYFSQQRRPGRRRSHAARARQHTFGKRKGYYTITRYCFDAQQAHLPLRASQKSGIGLRATPRKLAAPTDYRPRLFSTRNTARPAGRLAHQGRHGEMRPAPITNARRRGHSCCAVHDI